MFVLKGDMTKNEPLTEDVVLSMGNFDGVHRGHAYLIEQLKDKARANKQKSALLSFSPHPSQVLKKRDFLGCLLTEKDRIDRLSQLGVDYLFVQDFSSKFSVLEPEEFLHQWVVPFFRPKNILFGYDFRFGKDGRGDFDFTRSLLREINVAKAESLTDEGETLSSSKIRDNLKIGHIVEANQMLGYRYSLQGVVERGQALGRKLGFPTANMGKIETLVPREGVYAGVARVAGKRYKSVLNVGRRPTVSDSSQLIPECHLLDFDEDIYGTTISFDFVEHLRFEKKFFGHEDLKKQIGKDIVLAEKILEKHGL